MRSELSIRTLQERDYPIWNQLVAEAECGSVYALPAYLEVLAQVTDADFRILGVFKGDECVGGMPLYLSRCGFGRVAANRLLLYYHSPVVRDAVTKSPAERTARQLAILATLEEALRQVDCLHLLLHVRHPLADLRPFLNTAWQVSLNYSYVVDIGDLEVAWSRVHRNLRRLITRATRQGLVVTQDDDFESFYRLHQQTHERKGAPLYLPRPAFQTYLQQLQARDLCRLFHARLPDGRAVATQLVLTGPHPVTHTVCAGADAAYLNLGSTPFLRWRVFEALSAAGARANDLTDAALNDVTRFKSQLGGELVRNTLVTRTGNRLFGLYRFGLRARRRTGHLLRRWRLRRH
ncbi:hypothetical protein CKO25_00170 [Thiocapsa imhoffii]|uniref:BioF2-like acetyltransferase domain-containing protein n=1 Tax=Thiocapsa imhoffii TaxID=382777 RepID=A0A9X0WE90_9GAMM|nr:GNAT family N-acetyltransferase [Thiocapsa imhoffii]MBK1643094.1 hypothetical protein [Thiocapsa imhoffii]